jgi:nicotinamide-nucleotide amidase
MTNERDMAEAILRICQEKRLMVATAESCTGGLIAAALTEIAGSSAVVDRGFVTYSNAAKMAMLRVREETLCAHGAVSEETALEMAEGALVHSDADIAVSVTGIAGPTGATPDKPVGLVWFGLARKGVATKAERHVFDGDRAAVRKSACLTGLRLLAEAAQAS